MPDPLTPDMEEQVRDAVGYGHDLKHRGAQALLAALDAVRAELAAAIAVLRSVEWDGPNTDGIGDSCERCPQCYGRKTAGHHDGCALAAALAVPTGDPHA